MIEIPSPGIGTALLCAAVSFVFLSVRHLLHAWQKELGPNGWIPNNIDTASRVLRTLTWLAWMGCIVALLPSVFDPLIPIAAIAIIVLLTWSQRDNVRDLTAGWMLRGENTVVPGAYIRLGTVQGRIHRIGFRTTVLDNAENERVVLPNRMLIGAHVSVDTQQWPQTTFTVHTRSPMPHQRLQQHLNVAIAMSPWAAPAPVFIDTTTDPTCWTVRARAIDLQFASALKASLMEEIYRLDMEE